MSKRETADEIEADAARWVLRLDADGGAAETRQALEDWLDGDARRRGAFLQAEAAWALLDPVCSIGALEDAGASPEPEASPLPSRGMPRRRLLAGAGGLLAASLGAGFFWLGRGDDYHTALGEIRRVPLKDGSVAAINTDSRIKVALADRERAVSVDQGEAWFQVAKDASRPFIVSAGPARVRAVGTAFSVRRHPDGAEVLVTEGVVEAWREGGAEPPMRLVAGDRAVIADDAPPQKASPAPSEVDRRLAWRAGRIDLEGEALAQAAEEFNRYNSRQIVVAPTLASEQLYGVFRTDDPEGFARAVQASLGARIDLSDAQTIRIG
ncbi:FecR domain-containing protein [Brevundimonas sp. SORGH_AS_0993]|uniref:FecR family protein n=1 Tax=Brevundimonas sp. SORGH_AS_0993 TaxID=3041794 RepID=UPI0027D85427|nr:FecR domain-containing protein [Brevundimonas sp. SORGH_AS_0993]